MKRFAGREIALLMLPLLVLGGLVVVKQTIHSHNSWFDPEGLKTGPCRIQLGAWEDVPPTPWDVALGYTKVLRAPLHCAGELNCPVKIHSTFAMFGFGKLATRLEYQRGTKWIKWRERNSKIGGLIITQFPEIGNGEDAGFLTLKLPLASLRASGGDRLRVSGDVVGIKRLITAPWPAQLLPAQGTLLYPTRNCLEIRYPRVRFQLDVKAANQKLPRPLVDHDPGLQITQVVVTRTPPMDEWNARRSGATVGATLHWTGSGDAPNVSDIKAPFFELRDKTGRDWPQDESSWFYSGKVGVISLAYPSHTDFYCEWNVPLSQAPKSVGALRATMPVSLNERWPLWGNPLVRADWESRAAQKIKVTSARFIRTDNPGGGQGAVVVSLHYSGNTKLVIPELNSANAWQASIWQLNGGNGALRQLPHGHDSVELLANWSQRVQTAIGKDVAHACEYAKTGDVLSAGTRDFQILYPIVESRIHELSGLTFKAEIGLVGDGFVHVECPIGSASPHPPPPTLPKLSFTRPDWWKITPAWPSSPSGQPGGLPAKTSKGDIR